MDEVNNNSKIIIITRKNNKKSILMPMEKYNGIMEEQRRLKNIEYLRDLDESIQQIENGKVVPKTLEELQKLAACFENE
ncbi:hypothetical protein MmiAt1_16430 [Methanimicrococcus sp. At1]|uniref:Antitoxin n=1 Tax=Methanimicrococcus hacksteinii TaxID=3028293 RepID=A0ABU3VRK9_9EURY|nr:hypothetical protein [Methanimicrococcus sp. At1]